MAQQVTVKATRKQFTAAMAKHNATLDADSEDWGTLNIDAPRWHVWASTGSHCLCVPFANNGGQSWKPQAYREALDEMADGLEPCSNPDCDICGDEENWKAIK